MKIIEDAFDRVKLFRTRKGGAREFIAKSPYSGKPWVGVEIRNRLRAPWVNREDILVKWPSGQVFEVIKSGRRYKFKEW